MAAVNTGKSITLVGAAALTLTAQSLCAVDAQQYLKGELLLEGINQNNYTDGNDDANDRSNQMWIRARIGAKVELQDRVEAQVTLVYDAEGGDASPFDTADQRAELNVQDAYVLLKHFLRDDMYLRAGRQPVSFNLRTDYGAFVHDSRAHTSYGAQRPAVTGWDGVSVWWQRESLKFIPFYYILDEANESSGTQAPVAKASHGNDIFGIMMDWKPDSDGDNRMFVTGGVSIERNPYVGDALTGATVGNDLTTWYLGGTMKLRHGFDIYFEGAFQDGELDASQDFKGYGLSAGLTWHAPGERDAIVNLQYDHLSGDDNPADDDYEAFVATWEGTDDSLIVEHERYGELSELLVGNMAALKAKIEWGFMDNRMAMRVAAANYTLQEEVAGEDDFGLELDLELDFQYNDFTRFSIFGGVFLPGDGYTATTQAVLGSAASDDEVTLFGFNMQVLF